MSGGSATKETDRSDSSGGKKDGGDIHNKSYKGDIIARMRRIMFEDPEPTAERFQSNANKNFATHLHYDSEYNRKEETYSTRTNQGESREDNTNSNSLKKDSSEDADHPKNNTMRHDGSGSSEFSRGNSPTSLAQFAFLNSDAILRPAKKVEETEKNPPHNNNNNIVNPIQKEEAEDTIRTGGVFDATVNRFISSLVLNASDGSDSHHHQHRLSNNFSPTHSSVVAFPTSPAGIAFHQQSHSMDSTKGKGKPERTKVPTLSRAGVPAQQNDNTYFRKLQHNTTET
ncbi:hypothetical protein AGDE_13374 [Angomonas deanei]|uniref:Uncharacterized protein n=1 Tax=Angomonas deanei TaxID=59799 RepID=A0A7G2C4F3_9TRYP|nr:hypothetical protein AGDE_13374 [Angomonas deanei]CAD2214596.1 hypothetical protein, conserved [Angomonas deanei]|eukprot:EPY22435.1 hypothetical protein AGDE_13374 [Angomonas deanei]